MLPIVLARALFMLFGALLFTCSGQFQRGLLPSHPSKLPLMNNGLKAIQPCFSSPTHSAPRLALASAQSPQLAELWGRGLIPAMGIWGDCATPGSSHTPRADQPAPHNTPQSPSPCVPWDPWHPMAACNSWEPLGTDQPLCDRLSLVETLLVPT